MQGKNVMQGKKTQLKTAAVTLNVDPLPTKVKANMSTFVFCLVNVD